MFYYSDNSSKFSILHLLAKSHLGTTLKCEALIKLLRCLPAEIIESSDSNQRRFY